MFKKIAVITGLLFTLIPITNAFAEEAGMMAGKPFIFKGVERYEATDGNVSTKLELGGKSSAEFVFPSVIQIDKVLANVDSGNYMAIDFIDSEGNVLRTLSGGSTLNTYKYTPQIFSLPSVKKIVFRTTGNLSRGLIEMEVYGSDARSPFNITSTQTNQSIDINWNNPTTEGNNGTNLYLNGEKVTKVGKGVTNYTFKDLQPNTTYTIGLAATYENEDDSARVNKEIKTDFEPLALKDIKAKADYNRVDLSWNLPANETLKHVNIYRNKVETQSALATILLGEKVSAAAQTKIFETNGTYFNDLTVEPNTTYDYTLSITDTNGAETAYNDLQVKTPKEPTPVIVGGNLSKDENGDYTYTWEEPTKGQVKVLVGGKEYKTVNGSDKKIIIPSADMKYTILKDPDIQIVPISEYGTIGETTKPPTELAKAELPFEAKDLLGSGMQLLWIVAPFVLLALSFLLVPKLRRLIVQAFRGKGGKEGKQGRRTSEPSEMKPKTTQDKPEKEPREVVSKQKLEKAPRGIRVSERELKEPKIRREKAPKEPRISRTNREPREGRQRAARAERQPRTSREPRR